MISSPDRAIKPTPELARLTLETNQLTSARRSSTLQSQRRPTLGMADSQTVITLPSQVLDEEAVVHSEPSTQTRIPDVDPRNKEIHSPDHNPLSTTHDANTIVNQADSGIRTPDSSPKVEPQAPTMLPQPMALASPPSLQEVPLTPPPEEEETQKIAPQQSHPIEVAMQTTPEDPQHPPLIYAPPEGKPPPVPPRPTKLATIEEFARQQDVTEVLANAVFQLSCAIRGTGRDSTGEQRDVIHDTLYGEERVHVLQGTASPQPAVQFLFLNLPIYNDPKDVYAAIDNDFDVEERGSSEVYKTITKLPPVLCMLFGRVTVDAANQQKINSHIEVPSTLYMDRYLDAPEGSSLVERRAQAWRWKKDLRKCRQRIKALEPDNKPTVDNQLDEAIDALHQVGEVGKLEELGNIISQSAIKDQLYQLSQKVKAERKELHSKVEQLERQVNDSFTDTAFRQHEYKLHAAFFHRGSSGSGHYWVYIYDHVQEIWRKYNDDHVTHVTNLKEIFGNPKEDRTNPNYSPANPANPYFLVYVRSNRTAPDENIVETVTRQPIQVQQQPEVAVPEDSQSSHTMETEADLRPIGSDPTDTGGKASHHEFSDQPSQMSHMPPEDTKLRDWDEPDWDETALQEAVQQSLQPGDGTHWTQNVSEGNQSVPPHQW